MANNPIPTISAGLDCFSELDGSAPKASHQYVIHVNSTELTNWLHLSVRRADLQGRVEGVAIEAIDQDGLPVGRFGLYQCMDDSKYFKATAQATYEECDLPNENMKEHPNAACLDKRDSPPKEAHVTWRFTESDKLRIKFIQFIGIVVESFAKKKYFSNVRSPKITVNRVSLERARLAWTRKDLEGNCHSNPMTSQWTETTKENLEMNSGYVKRIKDWKGGNSPRLLNFTLTRK